jgi:HEAT repeats
MVMRKWFLPMLLGIIAVAIVVIAHKRAHPDYTPDVINMARGSGLPLDTCFDLLQISSNVEKRPKGDGCITPDEWERLRKHATKRGSPFEQMDALSTMARLRTTSHRSEAISIAQSLLQDPAPIVRENALITLHHLGSAALAEDAHKLLNDENERVRKQAAEYASDVPASGKQIN